MILYKKKAGLRQWLNNPPQQAKTTGFVPTMGALHEGHISLLKASHAENDITICSIFINPTQFNDPEDFNKYPVTIDRDIELLEPVCDILFLPTVAEMYPNGTDALKHYDLGYVETVLDGKYRPGHFQGVCNIVDRLLDIVQPSKLYVGQKDYQQCMVLARLLEVTGNPAQLVISPTLREDTGLAMSSRNMRLSAAGLQKAPIIHHALNYIKNLITPGPVSSYKLDAIKMIEAEGLKPDYVEIADARTLEPVETWNGKQQLVVLAAAFLNDVRLIDNMLIN